MKPPWVLSTATPPEVENAGRFVGAFRAEHHRDTLFIWQCDPGDDNTIMFTWGKTLKRAARWTNYKNEINSPLLSIVMERMAVLDYEDRQREGALVAEIVEVSGCID